jgi:hypothetical protein
MLCDAVISARQFMGVNHPAYYEKRSRDPAVTLTDWGPPENITERLARLNYQRWYPLAYDPNLTLLKYRHRYLRAGGPDFSKMVRSIQCVNTEEIKWFVTFNGVEKYMYLLEPGVNKMHSKLRITGMLEPSPVIETSRPNSNLNEYFFRQLQTSTGKVRI